MRSNSLAVVIGIGLVLTCRSYAGIPEPSIVLYGQVWDSQGTVVTSGGLAVTYTPLSGPTVTVPVALQAVPGSGGTMQLSYILEIPCQNGAGGAVSAGTLGLTGTPVSYTRSATLNGNSLSLNAATSVSVSETSRGQIERVDFGLDVTFADTNNNGIADFWEIANGFSLGVDSAGSDPDLDGFTNRQEFLAGTDPNSANSTPGGITSGRHHSGDYEQPFYQFSLMEMLGMVDLFTSTVNHDYHIDAADARGYSAGPGAYAAAPHSADYINGPDGKISLSELLRVIDLFGSNADHSYCEDPSSLEDGFTAYGCSNQKSLTKSAGAKSMPAGEQGFAVPVNAATLASGVEILQSVNTTHAAEGFAEISISILSNGGTPVSALGLTAHLPAGWIFQSLAGSDHLAGTPPTVVPHPGATGDIEFAWMPTPSMPLSFTYRVSVPQAGEPQEKVGGEGLLRFRGATGEAVVQVTDEPFDETSSDMSPGLSATQTVGLCILTALAAVAGMVVLRRRCRLGGSA